MDFSHQHQCLNCGAPLSEPYCSKCGQRRTLRISFKHFIAIAQRGFLELDSPIVRNLIDLTVRPGQTCREYIQGKRKKYFNPFRYSFWILTIFAILGTLLEVDVAGVAVETFGSNVKEDGFHDSFVSLLRNGYVYLFYFNVFAIAAMVRLFFRKSEFNFWEIYIAIMFVMGHTSILSILFLLFGVYSTTTAQFVSMFVSIVYPVITIAQMYLPHRKRNYVKSFTANLIGTMVAGIFMGLAAGIQWGFNEAQALKKDNAVQQEVNAQGTNAQEGNSEAANSQATNPPITNPQITESETKESKTIGSQSNKSDEKSNP